MTELFWYRYEDIATADQLDDEWGTPLPGTGHTSVYLTQYLVLKETRKGVWIRDSSHRNGRKNYQRFVLRGANKRYACPSLEEAKISFIARKRRQISINRARIRQAEAAIEIIKTGKQREDRWEYSFGE